MDTHGVRGVSRTGPAAGSAAPDEALGAALGAALAGRYAVERVLGRGGMATVYLAEDLRHRRKVAIKVLHPELGAALGAERFLREIELTAALQHPHILPLLDSGEAGDVRDGGGGRLLYYVMPFVEGESLRARLTRERQLPVDDALRMAGDAAAALDYAHRHGVIHRDVKPENILLHDGRALVADFGIARAVQRAASDRDTLTATGVSVGTPQYMSPEQAAGERDLDARSDIYSLGCVLYEMLAGSPPFTAPTAQGVVAKVLTEQPRPLAAERRSVPPLVARAVMTALEKLPADRFTTAAEFAAALEAPSSRAHRGDVARVTGSAPLARWTRPLTAREAVLVALVAVGVAAAAWLGPWVPASRARSAAARVSDAPLMQFDVELKSDGTLGSEVGTDIALSADGTRLVFAAHDADGRAHLYTRRLDQAAVTPLPETDGARGPFLSPDGRWVGFWADGKVKRTPIGGGSPVVLCDAVDLQGASWGDAGYILAAIRSSGGLWRIPESGGAPSVVLDPGSGDVSPRWPQFLPGGRAVLYTALGRAAGADRAAIEVLSLRTGERRTLLRGGTYGRYLPNGYLTFVNQGTLYAVPFDAERLAVRGTAVPLLDDVAYSRTFGYAQMDVSRSGMLVYRKSAETGPFVVARIDRGGAPKPIVSTPGRYGWLRLSPDGSRLALTAVESGTGGIWIHDTRGNETRRITRGSGDFLGVTWWTDSRRLIVGASNGLAWLDADRTDAARPLTAATHAQVPWSLAPGGSRLAYYELGPATSFDLWTVPVVASDTGLALGTPEPFLQTPAIEVYPSFSPDGKWMAYASNESGVFEIYVRHFPDDGTRVRISAAGGGRAARWMPNERELVYQTGDRRLMVTSYRVERGAFVATAPRPWAPSALGDAGVFPSFDLAPNGEYVVGLMPAASDEQRQSPNHVTVMFNFLDEVRRRVGASGSSEK